MRNSQEADKRRKPYLYEHYNIETFCTSQTSNVRSVLARFYNTLLKGLNENEHLPCYILIFCDTDIMANLELFDFGVTKTLEDVLKWLLINFNCTIETRKQDLLDIRLGAISSSSEPRLIWVNMLRKPDASGRKIFSLTCKFNDVLESFIVGDKKSHSLKISLNWNNSNFDLMGNLSPTGRVAYWIMLDTTMKSFDRGETNLRPQLMHSTYHRKPDQFHWHKK